MRNRDHQVSRSWPRASAVAERLWSPPSSETGEDEWAAAPRMQEHECRMLARLILSGVLGQNCFPIQKYEIIPKKIFLTGATLCSPWWALDTATSCGRGEGDERQEK